MSADGAGIDQGWRQFEAGNLAAARKIAEPIPLPSNSSRMKNCATWMVAASSRNSSVPTARPSSVTSAGRLSTHSLKWNSRWYASSQPKTLVMSAPSAAFFTWKLNS